MKVPVFSPGPSTGADTLNEEGANALARTIKTAWAACGYDVDVRVERASVAKHQPGCFVVRSDMIGGMPQRRLQHMSKPAKRRAA